MFQGIVFLLILMSLDITIQDVLNSCIHIGHGRRSRNPNLKPFIFRQKNGTQIIDINKTIHGLEKVASVISDIFKQNKKIIFILTDKENKRGQKAVEQLAKDVNQHWMTKWPGGTLTNIKTIRTTLRSLNNKEKLLENPNANITKKEKLLLQREIKKTKDIFEGLMGLRNLPDLAFVFNTVTDTVAIQECATIGIKVAAIVDTNGSINNVDYPIPGNDDALRSIEFICNIVRALYAQHKKHDNNLVVDKSEDKKESDTTQNESNV